MDAVVKWLFLKYWSPLLMRWSALVNENWARDNTLHSSQVNIHCWTVFFFFFFKLCLLSVSVLSVLLKMFVAG